MISLEGCGVDFSWFFGFPARYAGRGFAKIELFRITLIIIRLLSENIQQKDNKCQTKPAYMKHLSIFTVKERTIILEKQSQEITLRPFGDVHRDTAACDVGKWRSFLKATKDHDQEHTLYLGLGDYCDFAALKEQKKLKTVGLHQQTMDTIEEYVYKNNRKFSQEIKHMRGNLLGFIEGNHSWVFENGITATEDLANRMGTEYLGWLTFFTLKIKFRNTILNYYIVACHGKSGGKLRGASVNQVAELTRIFPTANLYIMGHNHDKFVIPDHPILLPAQKRDGTVLLKEKEPYLMRSGSFQKSYEPETPSYPVGRLMRPAGLGAPYVTIQVRESKTAGNIRYNIVTTGHV